MLGHLVSEISNIYYSCHPPDMAAAKKYCIVCNVSLISQKNEMLFYVVAMALFFGMENNGYS